MTDANQAEVKAAAPMGYEAMKLLREFVDRGVTEEFVRKTHDIVHVWKIRTDSETLRQVEKREPWELHIDGQGLRKGMTMVELMAVPFVRELCKDSKDHMFRRLVIKRDTLFAEICPKTKDGVKDPGLAKIGRFENKAKLRITDLS